MRFPEAARVANCGMPMASPAEMDPFKKLLRVVFIVKSALGAPAGTSLVTSLKLQVVYGSSVKRNWIES
jgi:hypothetical protein